MVKLFLDANIYLDLYRSRAVNKLLKPLIEISPNVLITQQVVNEVLRNKLNLARTFIKDDHSKFDLTTLPDALIQNAIDKDDNNFREKFKSLVDQLKSLKKEIGDIYESALHQVAVGSDKISISLEKEIFSKALIPTEEDLNLARKRKDLGNPPGKYCDPLGDQLSWEMILRHSESTGNEIWVVSRDGDYHSKTLDGAWLLNSFLAKEIKDKKIPEVNIFGDLATALLKFKETTKSDVKLPTKEDMDAAKVSQQHMGSKKQCCDSPVLKIIPNGRFDMYTCGNCNYHYSTVLADCDD